MSTTSASTAQSATRSVPRQSLPTSIIPGTVYERAANGDEAAAATTADMRASQTDLAIAEALDVAAGARPAAADPVLAAITHAGTARLCLTWALSSGHPDRINVTAAAQALDRALAALAAATH
jgi:hypothetical protein